MQESLPDQVSIDEFEATLPEQVRAELEAALESQPVPTEEQASPATSSPTETPVPPSPTTTPTTDTATPAVEAVQAPPVEAVEPPEPPAPTPTPGAQPETPQGLPQEEIERLQNIERENYQYRQQAQATRDDAEISRLLQERRQALSSAGWEDDAIKYALDPLNTLAHQAATAFRDRRVMTDAALAAGEQYSLDYNQVTQLVNSNNANEFRAMVNGFTQQAPTGRERAAEQRAETAEQRVVSLEKEFADLKKTVVPPGQRFGEIGGTAPPEQRTDIFSASSDALNTGEDMNDDDWKQILNFFEQEA